MKRFSGGGGTRLYPNPHLPGPGVLSQAKPRVVGGRRRLGHHDHFPASFIATLERWSREESKACPGTRTWTVQVLEALLPCRSGPCCCTGERTGTARPPRGAPCPADGSFHSYSECWVRGGSRAQARQRVTQVTRVTRGTGAEVHPSGDEGGGGVAARAPSLGRAASSLPQNT